MLPMFVLTLCIVFHGFLQKKCSATVLIGNSDRQIWQFGDGPPPGQPRKSREFCRVVGGDIGHEGLIGRCYGEAHRLKGCVKRV